MHDYGNNHSEMAENWISFEMCVLIYPIGKGAKCECIT